MHWAKRLAPLIATALALTACRTQRSTTTDSANGAVAASNTVDTTLTVAGATPPAIGPMIQVTKTDSKSVTDATQLAITPDNFAKFSAAADSVAALAGRDTSVERIAHTDWANAGSTDADAGLRLLESNPAISRAITSAGMSVRDYYVLGIALADAARYKDDPAAAPPTPEGAANAKFVRAHQQEIQRIRDVSNGPAVIVTPGSSTSSTAAPKHP